MPSSMDEARGLLSHPGRENGDEPGDGSGVRGGRLNRAALALSAAAALALVCCWVAPGQLRGRDRAAHQRASPDIDAGKFLNFDGEASNATDGFVEHPTGLLCWLVTRSSGEEYDLVQEHFQHNRSLFACEAYVVFSDMDDLGGIRATNIGELTSQRAPWGGWYNTHVFLKAWHMLAREGTYKRHEWVVKIDADTVFFPQRLGDHLKASSWSTPEFIKCGEMMLGPVEVFTHAAVSIFAQRGEHECTEDMWVSGEDGFINSCMVKLGVKASIDEHLFLSTTNAPDCADSSYVAFHPFVDSSSWLTCLGIAGG